MRLEPSDFNGLRAPAPPAALKTRVLGAARVAAAAPKAMSAWDRLAASGSARLGWAAAVVLLVGGHLALSLPAGPVDRFAGPGRAEGWEDPEIGFSARRGYASSELLDVDAVVSRPNTTLMGGTIR